MIPSDVQPKKLVSGRRTRKTTRQMSLYAEMRAPFTLDILYSHIKRDILKFRAIHHLREGDDGYEDVPPLDMKVWLFKTASYIAYDQQLWIRFCRDDVWKGIPTHHEPPDFNRALTLLRFWTNGSLSIRTTAK